MNEIAIATEDGEVSTLPQTADEKAKQLPEVMFLALSFL